MAGAESASAESESAAGVLEGAFEVEASADAADGALAFAGNELPHLGQNLARGLQTAWHEGQFFRQRSLLWRLRHSDQKWWWAVLVGCHSDYRIWHSQPVRCRIENSSLSAIVK